MKHLYGIVLSLLLVTSTFAQTSDPLSAKLNSVFANIDASQVPTGFLKEYGLPLVPLGIFNGVLSDSSFCYSSYPELHQTAIPHYVRRYIKWKYQLFCFFFAMQLRQLQDNYSPE